VTAVQIAVADQLVEGGPDGEPGDAQLLGQLALGRDRLPDLEGIDEVEHPIASVLLLAHTQRPKWYCPLSRCIRGIKAQTRQVVNTT